MPRDFFFEDTQQSAQSLPSSLRTLGPRQREIAQIVYANAAATPLQIQARLSEQRSVRVVRTLMDRLVAKGVLKRRRSGRHNEVIYVASIATQSVQEAALKRLITERFGGSVTDMAAAIAIMVKMARQVPRTSAASRKLANDWVATSSVSGSAVRNNRPAQRRRPI